jgi:hypothetical protein
MSQGHRRLRRCALAATSFLAGRDTVLSFRPHHGAVAQLVAHLVRNEGVRGSSPLSSTDITAEPQVKGPLPSRDEGLCGVWERSTAAQAQQSRHPGDYGGT